MNLIYRMQGWPIIGWRITMNICGGKPLLRSCDQRPEPCQVVCVSNGRQHPLCREELIRPRLRYRDAYDARYGRIFSPHGWSGKVRGRLKIA